MNSIWSSRGRELADPSALVRTVEAARECVPLQDAPELYEAMTVAEIEAEQGLIRWERAQRRRHRRRSVRMNLNAESRQQKAEARFQRQDERQRRWLVNAQAERARATNPDALVGLLHHRAKRSSLLLRCVIGVGMVWSAVNVGRNLTPADTQPGLTWWLLWLLSFGIEAMISVPILEIMAQAATAARLGKRVDRTRIVLFEACLLAGTVGLNCGPHLAAEHPGRAAEYAVAPTMVVVLMWVHAWLTTRYADLIDSVDPGQIATAQMAPASSPIAETPHRDEVRGRSARASDYRGDPEPRLTLFGTASEIAEQDSRAGAGADPVRIAHLLVATRRSVKSVEEIVDILEMAQLGTNLNAIAACMSARTATTWRRSTVERIIARAAEQGFPVLGPRLEMVGDQRPA